MPVALRETVFDPAEILRRYQEEELAHARGKFGAAVSFVGTVRDFRDGEAVRSLLLEHYPGMTERELERIVEEAAQRWDILDALVVHRVGTILPGEPIVLVAVWAAHRAAAFAACRYLIEELKSRAPFWKKEHGERTSRWVEHNTPAADAPPGGRRVRLGARGEGA